MPVEWRFGPIKDVHRRVTDKTCLLFFILYLISMIITGAWGLSRASNVPFYKVYDSSRNVCGEGRAKDFPLLYMQTFSKPYRSVCVRACPSFDYN